VRITGIILLGIVVIGAIVRGITSLRLGRSGRDTIPFDHRPDPGNRAARSDPAASVGSVNPLRQQQRPALWAGAHEEETVVAIKEPGITASPNRMLAMTAGTMFVIWGFLGYFFAGVGANEFLGNAGGYLWNAFLVNPALASIWVLLGALLYIVGLGNVVGSRNANLLVGIISLFLAVYGFIFKNTSANIFAANTTDNVFHLVVGIILVLTALGADKQNLRAIQGERRTQSA
jgi:hypothetical protein